MSEARTACRVIVLFAAHGFETDQILRSTPQNPEVGVDVCVLELRGPKLHGPPLLNSFPSRNSGCSQKIGVAFMGVLSKSPTIWGLYSGP